MLESGVEADHIIRFALDSADDLYLIGESLIQIEKKKWGVDPEKFMAYIRAKITNNGMYYLLSFKKIVITKDIVQPYYDDYVF